MENTNFEFPFEKVSLPSKGLLYPFDNPLSSGSVEMRYATTREEDILTNQNYISQGIVLDKLIQSMLVSKINTDDLLIGDKNALMVSARILLWGKDYTFSIKDPNDGSVVTHTIDLTTLKEKEIDEELISKNINEFNFVFPFTKTEITFKLLSVKDEKIIDEEVKGLKKINKQSSTEMSTRLKYMITSVAGDRSVKTIREFVDRLIAKDSRELREHIKKIQPDIKLSFEYDFGKGIEEVPIPMTIDFFWPST